VREVLYGPRAIKELDYFWNLAITTNHIAKAYVVYQGVQLALQKQLTQLNIVGDYKNTIQYFVTSSNPKEVKLKSLIGRI